MAEPSPAPMTRVPGDEVAPPSSPPDKRATDDKRILWIDAAKGVAAILVVVYHAVNGVRGNTDISNTFLRNYIVLSPVITPIFFVVGGFFAQKTFTMSWRKVIDSRFIYFMYFYILWSVISIVIRSFMSDAKVTNHDIDYQQLLTIPWKPVFTMWFMYAFAITFLIVKAVRRVPPLYVIGFAIAAQATALHYDYLAPGDLKLPLNVGWFLPYFLFGLYASKTIRDAVHRMNVWNVLGSFAIFLVAAFIGMQFNAIHVPLVYLTISVASSFAIMGGCQLVQHGRLGRVLAFVGERSFPVYLLHFLPVAGFRIILQKTGLLLDPYLIVLVVVPSTVVACLVGYEVLMRLKVTFLFDRPSFLSLERWWPERRPPAPTATVPAGATAAS